MMMMMMMMVMIIVIICTGGGGGGSGNNFVRTHSTISCAHISHTNQCNEIPPRDKLYLHYFGLKDTIKLFCKWMKETGI
jgi:hypothetical protein